MPQNGAISSLNYLFCYLETLFVIKQKIRRMFIRAYLAIDCKLCLMSLRYLVLLFLVWKLYWNMTASTLLCSSKGIASIFRLTSTLSTCSLEKYQYVFLPLVSTRLIFYLSGLTGIAVLTSPVALSGRVSVMLVLKPFTFCLPRYSRSGLFGFCTFLVEIVLLSRTEQRHRQTSRTSRRTHVLRETCSWQWNA